MTEQKRPGRARRILTFPVLRVLWAVLIFSVAVVPISIAFGPGRNLLLIETVQAAAAVLALYVVGRFIERRRAEEFGFGHADAWLRNLLVGFLIGAMTLTLVVGALALPGWYRITGLAASRQASKVLLISSGGLAGIMLQALVFFLVVAIFEEVLFRGIIFRIMEEGIGSWGAIVLSSLIFGGAHLSNPHSSLFAAIAIAVEAGVMLGGAYMLTRDLWMAIGIHWSWNFFEGPVFGTAVSGGDFPVMVRSTMSGPALWTGGSFGPEAGLVAFIVAGSIGALLIFLAVRKGETRGPMWATRKTSPEQT